MTAAELVRYNLGRLVAESGRTHADIAIAAWPAGARGTMTAKQWRAHVDVRRKRLLRYLDASDPVEPPLLALGELARALRVPLTRFFRLPN